MFEHIDLINVISMIATPVAGVLSYFAGRKKKDNDFLQDLQGSINMLSDKNSKLIEELVTVKEQNIELKMSVRELQLENEKLSVQIKSLRSQLDRVMKKVKTDV